MARFEVHKLDGTSHMFTTPKKGMFFSDVKHDNAHILVNTVDSIKINIQLKSTLMHIKPSPFKT